MEKSKEERAAKVVCCWIFVFVVINTIGCFAQHGVVSLRLILSSFPNLWWAKLMMPSVFAFILALYPTTNLSEIKSKTTGDGQHGTARFSTNAEIRRHFIRVTSGRECIPGFVVGREGEHWIVDASDKSLMVNAPPGAGKTTCIAIPNLYYNAAVNVNTRGYGASFLCTDMKGDLIRLCGKMLEDCGYALAVLNLRNPFNSHCFNLINNTNKHMEQYLKATSETERLKSFGAAERYAKMLSQSIVYNIDTSSKSDSGQYFNETAQGLMTGIILLVSEYACKGEMKHILSVFNLIIELNGASETAQSPNTVQRNKLQELLQFIDNDRIRQHVGPAMSADVRSSMNIFSSALGKLVGLIDAEMEQMIANHSPELDDIDFIARPTAIFIICPDDIPTRYFFGSLFLRYFLNDLIAQARASGSGKLEREVFCFWDEFGNMPPIKDIDTLFSAVRSAGVRLMPVIQSLGQLRKSYSKETADIILSTCQITLTSHVSPLDYDTAQHISKALGNRTVQSGSVSVGSKSHKTVQLTGRPLMTPDEVINMQFGEFICMKMGMHPMRTRLSHYSNYLKVYPEYKIPVQNKATAIEKMTVEDIKRLAHSIKLHKGMFG